MSWYRSSLKTGGGGGTNFADLLALASGTAAFDLSDSVLHSEATKIPKHMFRENNLVQEVNMANITAVGDFAFYASRGITKVFLPACTSVGSGAFQNAGSDGKFASGIIYLPEVLTIGAEAFRNLQRQSQLMITLTKCTTIGTYAFRGGSGGQLTTTLTLPAIETIGQFAFGEQTITTVDIGSSCTNVGDRPFYNGSITNLIVRATTPPAMGANGLGTTPTHIYVPSEVVELYKDSEHYPRWAAYASIIEAIQE